MKTRSLSFAIAVLALLAGATAWWGASSAARAAALWNSTMVLVTGTVSGAPESVAFSGSAELLTRVARDPDDSSRSKVLLQINWSGVTGVGTSTATQYVISSNDMMQRPLAASDIIRLTFPFGPAGQPIGTRSGLASFSLDIDVATGAITSATARISTPDF